MTITTTVTSQLTLASLASTLVVTQSAMAKGLDPTDGPVIPFTMIKDKSGNWVDVTPNTNTNTNTVTSDKAKSDSAAVAKSNNEVKCFAFCLKKLSFSAVPS